MKNPEYNHINHAWFYQTAAVICDPIVKMLGGYNVHNIEVLRQIEDRGAIIAPSHRAESDSFVVGLSIHNADKHTKNSPNGPLKSRPIYFGAKSEMWEMASRKWFVENCGAFKIVRNTKQGLTPDTVKHMGDILTDQALICLYPEGRRMVEDEYKDEVVKEKLKTSIAFSAIFHGVPILTAGLAGSNRPGKLPREIVFGSVIAVEQNSDYESLEFKSQKVEVMSQLHEYINRDYKLARQYHLGQTASGLTIATPEL